MAGSRLSLSRKKVWGWGALLLLLLCWYGYAFGPVSKAIDMLADRQSHRGKTAGVQGSIVAVYQDHFLIRFDSTIIRINGRLSEKSLNKMASVVFKLTPERDLRLVEVMVSYLRCGRIMVSIVCLLLFSLLFLRSYRLQFSPLGIVEK